MVIQVSGNEISKSITASERLYGTSFGHSSNLMRKPFLKQPASLSQYTKLTRPLSQVLIRYYVFRGRISTLIVNAVWTKEIYFLVRFLLSLRHESKQAAHVRLT